MTLVFLRPRSSVCYRNHFIEKLQLLLLTHISSSTLCASFILLRRFPLSSRTLSPVWWCSSRVRIFSTHAGRSMSLLMMYCEISQINIRFNQCWGNVSYEIRLMRNVFIFKVTSKYQILLQISHNMCWWRLSCRHVELRAVVSKRDGDCSSRLHVSVYSSHLNYNSRGISQN